MPPRYLAWFSSSFFNRAGLEKHPLTSLGPANQQITVQR
jgi:hypothetical protein